MRGLIGLALCLGLASATACGSSGTTTTGGAVLGPSDDHCVGTTPPPIASLSCPASDANATADPNDQSDYGATMYNAVGDDDDCKYHVEWSVNNVEDGQDATFTVKASWLVDGSPLVGAATRAEVFYGDDHVAPNSSLQTTTEDPNGTYTIKAVQFDEKGQWTVRFHFYENCVDDGNSLHGHAAFFVNVP